MQYMYRPYLLSQKSQHGEKFGARKYSRDSLCENILCNGWDATGSEVDECTCAATVSPPSQSFAQAALSILRTCHLLWA